MCLILIVSISTNVKSQSVGTFTGKYTATSLDGSTVAKTYSLPVGTMIYDYTGTSADTCKGSFLWAKSIYLPNIDYACIVNAQLTVSDTTGNIATLELLGKVWLTDSVWTSITSRTYGGGQLSDTIVNFNPAATPIYYGYRFYQVRVTNLVTAGTRPVFIRRARIALKKV